MHGQNFYKTLLDGEGESSKYYYLNIGFYYYNFLSSRIIRTFQIKKENNQNNN